LSTGLEELARDGVAVVPRYQVAQAVQPAQRPPLDPLGQMQGIEQNDIGLSRVLVALIIPTSAMYAQARRHRHKPLGDPVPTPQRYAGPFRRPEIDGCRGRAQVAAGQLRDRRLGWGGFDRLQEDASTRHAVENASVLPLVVDATHRAYADAVAQGHLADRGQLQPAARAIPMEPFE
jgi:hypothetical protein